MKKAIFAVIGTTVLFFAAFYFLSNRSANKKERTINPAFKQYIYAFTSGYVTSESKIRVVLQDKSKASEELNKLLANSLFKFTPNLDGKMMWLDANTVEFRPDEPMKNGQEYEVEFLLSEVAEVQKDLKRLDRKSTRLNSSHT